MIRIGKLVWMAVVLALAPTLAAAVPCSVEMDGRSICFVSRGDSSVTVFASSLNGGEFELLASAGDRTQMIQYFKIYSFDLNEYIDVILDSATEDAATGQIVVQFTEAFASAIRATAVVTLDDQGMTTVLDESFTFLSQVPLFESASGRFYIITDYDLDGDFTDETVLASPGGLSITQTDGATTSTQQVFDPAPSAFDVAIYPQLSEPIIAQEQLVALAGRQSAAGPADFQYAVSYDRSLASGASITATMRQTITVPEPAALFLSAASLVTLAAIARSSNSHRLA